MASRHAHRQLVALLAATFVLTLGFHRLGSNPDFSVEWSLRALDEAAPETALAALLRTIGLLCCYWVLVTTTLYALTQRTTRAPQALRWATAPLIRRMVDRSLAVSLAISALAGPAQPLLAAEDPPPAIALEIHADGIPVPYLRLGPASPPMAGSYPATETNARTASPLLSTDRYEVVRGDSLWLIASRRVQTASAETTERMVAAYWRQLIDANLAGLRSGDPNLIYPGEILTLPSLEGQQ